VTFIRTLVVVGVGIVLLLMVGPPVAGESSPRIDRDEANRILTEEVLPGLSIPGDYVVFGYPLLLGSDDELAPYAPHPMPPGVTSLPHLIPYSLDRDTWFFWIDVEPFARYSHPTRFVRVDASTGAVVVREEGWWPVLNGRSLWTDRQDYWDRDNWIGARLSAIQGDYGDAPEGQDTGYISPPTVGKFPTLYDPGMPPGYYVIHRFPLDIVFLGDVSKGDTVTVEPDGRVVDRDLDDGVIPARLRACAEQTIDIEVTVQPNAPEAEAYYLNLLFDWNHDGQWEGYVSCSPTEHFPDGRAQEWAIRNLRLDRPPYNVGPGFCGQITTPAFLTGTDPERLWIRATISTQPVDETLHVPADRGGPGWNGSGYFLYGETEDYGWPFEPQPPAPTPPPPPSEDIGDGECALVVNGWSEGETGEQDFKEDEIGMSSVFQSAGINTKTLGPGFASPQTMELAIRRLAASGCTELVVYVSCHGSPNTLWIGGQAVTDADLTRMLQSFPGDVYVLLDCCYSGSHIPTLSGLPNARKVKTACGDDEYSYGDWDPPEDPNPDDKGGEWTSGYKEDLQELLHPSNFRSSVAAPAEEEGLPMKFVLLNKGYESAVEKDAAAIYGLNTPQNYHSTAGAPQPMPQQPPKPELPHIDCLEEMAEGSREEYAHNLNYYTSRYADKWLEFLISELNIYKDSPYVSPRIRRCARDILQRIEENPEEAEAYAAVFWAIFAK